MKIATWNINSLNIRLPHVLQWLEKQPIDILCLQETKLVNAKFPVKTLRDAGWYPIFNGQKTYNGVAILSKIPAIDIQKDNPLFPDDQKRIIAATYYNIRVICIYIPNGQSVQSEKYTYKMNWLYALHQWLKEELKKYPHLILLGDFNIVVENRDIYDPAAYKGEVPMTDPERNAFYTFQNLGLVDAFRLFEQPEKTYSWWDYRQLGFPLNKGMRIDHIMLSPSLAKRCLSCAIDKTPRKWERPSDHAPMMAEIAIDSAINNLTRSHYD